MIINYDEINIRAKARADKVREVQEAAARIPDAIMMLDEAFGFFENFGQLVEALDAEGREMLGAVATTAISIRFLASDCRRSFFKEGRNVLQLAAEVAE